MKTKNEKNTGLVVNVEDLDNPSETNLRNLVAETLRSNGYNKLADEMIYRVNRTASYAQSVSIMLKYVDFDIFE